MFFLFNWYKRNLNNCIRSKPVSQKKHKQASASLRQQDPLSLLPNHPAVSETKPSFNLLDAKDKWSPQKTTQHPPRMDMVSKIELVKQQLKSKERLLSLKEKLEYAEQFLSIFHRALKMSQACVYTFAQHHNQLNDVPVVDMGERLLLNRHHPAVQRVIDTGKSEYLGHGGGIVSLRDAPHSRQVVVPIVDSLGNTWAIVTLVCAVPSQTKLLNETLKLLDLLSRVCGDLVARSLSLKDDMDLRDIWFNVELARSVQLKRFDKSSRLMTLTRSIGAGACGTWSWSTLLDNALFGLQQYRKVASLNSMEQVQVLLPLESKTILKEFRAQLNLSAQTYLQSDLDALGLQITCQEVGEHHLTRLCG